MSCTLRADNSGTCGVTVNSNTIGAGVIVLESVTSLGGLPGGASVPIADAIAGGVDSRTAQKLWVRLEADVAPSATNPVGEAHTFTINAGIVGVGFDIPTFPGAIATFEWTGSGVPTGATSGPGPGQYQCVLVVGACDVTVSSTVPETTTLSIVEVWSSSGAIWLMANSSRS